ncbi:CheY-like superfamily [Pseudocohnilembus persalinus]|uniref:CheY-like superfamily n=1 Tax=Pseudocohnilembus persalinus TaxID=266149 RepID=A0A0V0QAY1_PSEPJ|nr:CheY-like superfamily [Pseudocohnilembus persalinus]|eukprot:KRW99404.1 CheY-like superfamily [Pseudocohnilembus persalinus]
MKKKSNFSQKQIDDNEQNDYFSQNLESSLEDQKQLQNECYQENCVCSKILLVDDDLFNINSIQMILKTRYNIFCDTAYNGLEAFELVESKQDKDNICKNGCDSHYKLIIMDIDMPIMDGIQSAKKIYDFYKKNNQMQNYPQIISHTAYDLDNNLQELHKQKVFKQSLSKPIALIELDNLINNQDFLDKMF